MRDNSADSTEWYEGHEGSAPRESAVDDSPMYLGGLGVLRLYIDLICLLREDYQIEARDIPHDLQAEALGQTAVKPKSSG